MEWVEDVNVKKKFLLMIAAGLLVSTFIIGGTLAAGNTGTDGGAGTAIAAVTTKAISIAIKQPGTTDQNMNDIKALPGKDSAYPCNVSNDVTGKDAYDIYAKVTINRKWQNKGLDGTNVSLLYNNQNQTAAYQPVDNTQKMYKAPNDWIVAYADNEQIVLYYTKPLAKGESSTNFVDAIHFGDRLDNNYAGIGYNINCQVDAVQVSSGEDAMAAEWGMFPLIDKQGNISGVYETRAERDGMKKQ